MIENRKYTKAKIITVDEEMVTKLCTQISEHMRYSFVKLRSLKKGNEGLKEEIIYHL